MKGNEFHLHMPARESPTAPFEQFIFGSKKTPLSTANIFTLTPHPEVSARLSQLPERVQADTRQKITVQEPVLRYIQSNPSLLATIPFIPTSSDHESHRTDSTVFRANFSTLERACIQDLGMPSLASLYDFWADSFVATLHPRMAVHLAPYAVDSNVYTFADVLSAARFDLLTADTNEHVFQLSSKLLELYLPSFLPKNDPLVVLVGHGKAAGSYTQQDATIKQPLILLEAGIPAIVNREAQYFGPSYMLTPQEAVRNVSTAIHEKLHRSSHEQIPGYSQSEDLYQTLYGDVLEGIAVVGTLHVLRCWKQSVRESDPGLMQLIDRERNSLLFKLLARPRRLDRIDLQLPHAEGNELEREKYNLIQQYSLRRSSITIENVEFLASKRGAFISVGTRERLVQEVFSNFKDHGYGQPYSAGTVDIMRGLLKSFGFKRVFGLDGQPALLTRINLEKCKTISRNSSAYNYYLRHPEALLESA